jgi:hypothetical protein
MGMLARQLQLMIDEKTMEKLAPYVKISGGDLYKFFTNAIDFSLAYKGSPTLPPTLFGGGHRGKHEVEQHGQTVVRDVVVIYFKGEALELVNRMAGNTDICEDQAWLVNAVREYCAFIDIRPSTQQAGPHSKYQIN